MSIIIHSAFFTRRWSLLEWQTVAQLLPEASLERVQRFRRWQDGQLSALGVLLLRRALLSLGEDPQRVHAMTLDSQERPLIRGGYDFNVSHSGSGAVCAMTTCGRVGVDLELFRVVEPQHFALCMSAAQLEAVKHHENPSRALLTLWVEKESVIKADGCAFNADLRTLQRQGQSYSLGAEVYTVAGVALHPDYLCCVAHCGTSEHVVEVVVWDGDLLPHRAEVLKLDAGF